MIGESNTFFSNHIWNSVVILTWEVFRWGTYSTTGAINAGLDLEMPGATKWRGEILIQAVMVNKVPEHVLTERARNVLNLVNRCAAANIPERAEEKEANTPETAAFLKKIGADSIVLMKNEDKVLPLKKDKKVCIMTTDTQSHVNFVDTHHWTERQSCHLPRRRISISRSLLRYHTLRRNQRSTYLPTPIHCRLLCPQGAPSPRHCPYN